MLLITISKIDRWGRERNINKLLDSLKYDDDEIRKAAALCLGRVGDASILEILEYAYKTENNIFVKKDISSAIRQIKDKKFIPGTPIFEDNNVGELQPAFSYQAKLGS